jgi:bacterioferritin-associated ferredoxin
MYVCLCKPLTESDVVMAARACLASGCVGRDEIMERLGLHCEEACGFCAEHPEELLSIAESEWESATGTPIEASEAYLRH